MKNKTTAAVLAFLLGGIGAHKFYLGRAVQGLIYLVFCWTFIPLLISLIEFIMYLSMTDDAFDAKYNQHTNLNSGISNADELEKLHNLKEKGVITEDEFQAKKTKLIR